MIYRLISELNEENGSIHKMNVLKKHKDNILLKQVLKMTYDKVAFSYGITMKNISYTKAETNIAGLTDLSYGLAVLENSFCTRSVTGNQAVALLTNLLSSMNEEDAYVLSRVVDRDLKINMGRSNINKVFSGLITKPIYQRCDVYTEDSINAKGKVEKGSANKIKYPAKLDLKADGTYREVQVSADGVFFVSRSGEEYTYPEITKQFLKLPEGRYFGELTVSADVELLNIIMPDIYEDNHEVAEQIMANYDKGITTLPRAIGNGLINSDNPPHNNIIMDVWQYVTEEEYVNAGNKISNDRNYYQRFQKLEEDINNLIQNSGETKVRVCMYEIVNSKQEALQQVSKWMNDGFEGGVLKNLDMAFRDGTNPEQLKMKLAIELEVRCTGFTDGKRGTKREKTFGAMTFETDDGNIKGQTSGFSDKMLEELHNNRDKYIGKVFSIICNDLTKGKGNEYYALSYPRFSEWRDDKDETDTIEKAFEYRLMAMGLNEK